MVSNLTDRWSLIQVNSLLESAMEEGLDDVQDSPVLNALMASQITKDATLDQSSPGDAVYVSPDDLQTDNGGGTGIAKALKRNAADIDGSDDDDFNPTAAVALKSRRLTFQGYETRSWWFNACEVIFLPEFSQVQKCENKCKHADRKQSCT